VAPPEAATGGTTGSNNRGQPPAATKARKNNKIFREDNWEKTCRFVVGWFVGSHGMSDGEDADGLVNGLGGCWLLVLMG